MKAFTWSPRVRSSEIGPDGLLKPLSALHLLQETGVLASEANGYGPQRYLEMGMTFMVYQLDVVFDGPARLGDTLVAKSWVSDFKLVRSRRETVVTTQDGAPVFRANVMWIFMDAATRRPAKMKEKFRAAFLPAPGTYAHQEPSPPTPALLAPPVVGDRTPRYTDLDGLAHVNHAVSLSYVLDDLAERNAGALGTLRRVMATYAGQLSLGESAEVITLGELREGNRVTTSHEVRSPQEQVLTATVVREV
ncbi:MAG: acyl-ACP thioesterase domain-containing protein [Myxococcota bacterium]